MTLRAAYSPSRRAALMRLWPSALLFDDAGWSCALHVGG
jgi:hypothetical protein